MKRLFLMDGVMRYANRALVEEAVRLVRAAGGEPASPLNKGIC